MSPSRRNAGDGRVPLAAAGRRAGGRGPAPAAAAGDAPVRAGRAGQGLRSERRRGAAQPRLRLRHEGARRPAAGLGRPVFLASRSRSPASWPAGSSTAPRSPPACCTTRSRTPAPRSRIERLFGAEVARLVDGVTKLNKLELQSSRTEQAENFRKLLLAMSEDIRVLLVKLADRLHNMRTLHFIAKHREAAADRPRDDGDLRAARRADRHAGAQGRARGPGLRRAVARCARERSATAWASCASTTAT